MDERAVERAELLIGLRRWSEALNVLANAGGTGSESAHAHALRAQCLLGLDDARGALAEAERARAADPDNEWTHRLVAIANQELGRRSEALRAAREAARLAPWSVPALQVLAYAQLNSGYVAAAAETAAQAVEQDPESELAHEAVARVALRQDELLLAERAARTALQLDPEDDQLQALLAEVLERRGHSAAARDLRVTAVRTAPQNADHRAALGRVAVPLVAVGWFGKYLIFQGVVRIGRWVGAASLLALVVLAHVVLLLLWSGYAWRRRRSGRDLPAGYYDGLRPQRRRTDLRWLWWGGVLTTSTALVALYRYAYGQAPGSQALLLLGAGAAELAAAVMGNRHLARRYGGGREESLLDTWRRVAGVTGEAIVRRADLDAAVAVRHDLPLSARRRHGLKVLAAAAVLGLLALLVSLPVALLTAVAVAAGLGALGDGRSTALGDSGDYRVVLLPDGSLPGRLRLAARSALRLLLLPLVAVEHLVFSGSARQCVHDRLTGVDVVRMSTVRERAAAMA